VLSPFVHGTTTGSAGVELGGDGSFQDTSLKSSLRSHQGFGRFDYDLTDTVHAFAEVAINEKQNGSFFSYQNLNNVTFSSQNAFLAPAYRAQLAAANQATFRLSKTLADVPQQRPITKVFSTLFNSGLSGELGDKFKWDLGYVHSKAELKLTNTLNTNNGRLYAALDAVTNPATGQVVCNVTLTNPGLYPGCVPLNAFGPTSDTLTAAADYIYGPTSFIAHTKMDDVSGGVSGSPFSSWAGPVTVAASAEYRKVGYSATSDAVATNLLPCTGLRFNCTAATTVWTSNSANRSPVSQTVKEGALEADVPLLKDLPLVQSLNVNGGVRYTKYSTSGSYTTWKIGADWHVTDELRLRGTRSRDIRAPTLGDLFDPQSSSVSTNNFNDPLTKQAVVGVITVSGGNPALKAEEGNTWTAGVVYRPAWVNNLAFTVDYYDIRVTNSILSLLSTNVTVQNACVASGGVSPYCQLFERPLPYSNTTPANNVPRVFNKSVNFAEQSTHGVDVEVNYGPRLFGRPASLRVLTAYQPSLLYVQDNSQTLNQAGAAFGNGGVTSAPTWRVTGFLRFSPLDKFSIDIQSRWRSSLRGAGDPTLVFDSAYHVKSVSFTNLNFGYKLDTKLGQSDLFLNISNLFNTKPPAAASYNNTTPGNQTAFVIYDDALGRAFTVGVRFRR
jgi:iron complex outermembrane receptor protein